MKARSLAAIAFAFILCAVTAAQGYSIRIDFNTNLRAGASLQARIVETAPAGSTLHVVGELGRWLRINRNGNEVWMASWVRHSRVEDSSQASSGTAAQIDNCCFVDRECTTDQEWTDGYWAFQNGQCAAPSTSQADTSAQPAVTEAGPIDNCCFAGWHCQTDEEWTNGYWAFRDNQCDAPAESRSEQSPVNSCCQLGWNCGTDLDWWLGEKVINDGFECDQPRQFAYGRTVIDGSDTFFSQITASLEYLRSSVPHWYAYIVNGVRKIRGGPWGPGSFALGDSLNIAPTHASEATIVLAGTLLHEACHVNRLRDGSFFTTGGYDTVSGFSVEEHICEVLREGALTEANPSRPTNPWLEAALAHYFGNGGQFDFQAAANRERDRAFGLLSQGI